MQKKKGYRLLSKKSQFTMKMLSATTTLPTAATPTTAASVATVTATAASVATVTATAASVATVAAAAEAVWYWSLGERRGRR